MEIVIIGGGASGFMAAITAAELFKNTKITILEKNRTVLNKVRISGGGRCNVTHQPLERRFFIKNYPRGEKMLRKLFEQFDASNTVQWFANRGVELKTEADGRMFPITDSSHTIIECLMREAKKLDIEVITSCGVKNFAVSDHESGRKFTLETENNEIITADRLLIATGGYPKLSGFDWIKSHSHDIVEPVPSLFTFNTPDNPLLNLAGVAVQDCLVKISGTKLEWRGPLMITHWGFSGPAVLKLSAWGARILSDNQYDFVCRINWIPEYNEEKIREMLMAEKVSAAKQLVHSHAKFGLPIRLWKEFAGKAEIPENLRWMEASHKMINRLVEYLTNSQFEVKGKTTFKEEFVTCGGVQLDNINQATMESKSVQGLFFSGEVIDADGITGGFNFQNAWTTGYVAGKNIGL